MLQAYRCVFRIQHQFNRNFRGAPEQEYGIRSFIRPVFCVAIATICLAACVFGGEQTTVALLEFESTVEYNPKYGEKLRDLLTAELTRAPGFRLVDRATLYQLTKERKLKLSGILDDTAAAKTAGLLSAQTLITGRVYTLGGELWVSARVFKTGDGRSDAVLLQFGKKAELSAVSAKLSAELAKKIAQQPPSIPVDDKPEAAIENIKRLWVDKPRPTVIINTISLASLPDAIVADNPEPAVMKNIRNEAAVFLKKCGFTVIIPLNAEDKTGTGNLRLTFYAATRKTWQIESQISCGTTLQMKAESDQGGSRLIKSESNGGGTTLMDAAYESQRAAVFKAMAEFLTPASIQETIDGKKAR